MDGVQNGASHHVTFVLWWSSWDGRGLHVSCAVDGEDGMMVCD